MLIHINFLPLFQVTINPSYCIDDENFSNLIKTKHPKKEEKKYKMDGPKSWQKEKTTKGGGPQEEHEQVKYSNPLGAKNISNKKRGRTLEKTHNLKEPLTYSNSMPWNRGHLCLLQCHQHLLHVKWTQTWKKRTSKTLCVPCHVGTCIPFVFNSFSFNVRYLPWFVTFYNCTFFTLSLWTYHRWFGYPLVAMHVQKWTHYNPWHFSIHLHNYWFAKWNANTHTQRGLQLFLCPTQQQINIFLTSDDFWTLMNIVIVNPTCPDMIQCASSTTTRAMTIVIQEKTYSYKERARENNFIILAIEIYGCLHFCFDPFFTSCA